MENLIYAQECALEENLDTLKIITPLKGYCEIENCTEKAAYNLPRVKPAIRCISGNDNFIKYSSKGNECFFIFISI
jgi:hypothetical protein